MVKLHHVGIVCSEQDYLQQRKLLEIIQPSQHVISKHVPEFKCTCHLLGNIEWVIPDSDSVLQSWLESQGRPSIHHFAIIVDDIQEVCQKLTLLGIKLVTEKPVNGVDNIQVNFIHPTVFGVMVELVQVIH